jgi:hypothetical protein
MCELIVNNQTGDVEVINPDGTGMSVGGQFRTVKVPHAPESVFADLLACGEAGHTDRDHHYRKFYLEPRMLPADGATASIDFIREIKTYRDYI